VAGDEKQLGAEIFKVVGPRIAERRLELGLNQEDLAYLAGLHRTAISPLESGKRGIRLVNAFRLAAALGMTISELLDGVYWDHDGGEFTDQPPGADGP
jgi:transcriptional regulator with XRE-family HTH domain